MLMPDPDAATGWVRVGRWSKCSNCGGIYAGHALEHYCGAPWQNAKVGDGIDEIPPAWVRAPQRAPSLSNGMLIQRRYEGLCTEHPTVQGAFAQPYDKVSFSVPQNGRVILWADGTYEVRTPESLRAQYGASETESASPVGDATRLPVPAAPEVSPHYFGPDGVGAASGTAIPWSVPNVAALRERRPLSARPECVEAAYEVLTAAFVDGCDTPTMSDTLEALRAAERAGEKP